MRISLFAVAAALGAPLPVYAGDLDTTSPEMIVVTAPRLTAIDDRKQADEELVSGPDAAAFLARQPGMDLVSNGQLSGQVQMRGLFGERILLRINGQRFATGGPNAMDPAMHYAPMPLLDRFEIARGISPVRDGPGLGGGINAVLKQIGFGDAGPLAPHVDLASQYRTVDQGTALGGLVGLSNDWLRIGATASREQGDDGRFPGGRIAATSYNRAVYGIHAGVRVGSGEVSIEYRRQNTGRSGNPPFAMDIVYFHTDFVQMGFTGTLAPTIELRARASYTAVDHRMNNYSLRPAPATAAQRQSDTYADTMTADAALRFGTATRHVQIGIDAEIIDKGYMLYNPLQPAFFIHPLDGATTQRIGAFVEWRTALGPIEAEAGIRLDNHRASTGDPRFGPGVPVGPVNLARSFSQLDRRWSASSADIALRLWSEQDDWTPRLTLARKTRVPSLIERFSWLPTEASGGLADGNIYVGDVNLKPETAWVAEIGTDWATNGFYARPIVFYRRIDNFIQGVPYDSTPGLINTPVEMVASASGDSTPLRFANTDATLYGFDIAFGAHIVGPLRFDGMFSHVRGKRRDIKDNLYRMAPDNGRISVSWVDDSWSVSGEAEWVSTQRKTSVTNGEAATASHLLVHAHARWSPTPNLRLDVGIENIFNRAYVDHLAGYNRIAGSDVGIGERLPGLGRSAFLKVSWAV